MSLLINDQYNQIKQKQGVRKKKRVKQVKLQKNNCKFVNYPSA